MATILKTKSYYYNDVNLIAQLGKVKSRLDVPKELNRIIVSPMPAVVGKKFAITAADLGLTVCLHRFCEPKQQLLIYESIFDKSNIYCAIGLDDIERVKLLNSIGVTKYIIDFANGYMPNIKDKLIEILKYTKIESIIIGNVHSLDGVNYLKGICKNLRIKNIIIRVGIAGGTPCETSDTVGINRGNITEIIECSSFPSSSLYNIGICADGGITKGAFACKAFAAGSHNLMMGSFWMQSLEAESNISGDGSYWGCASKKNQLLSKGKITRHSEGKELDKIYKELKPLKEVVDELWGNISSYVSYSGYSTLTNAIGNGIFEIKENSLPPRRYN